MSRKTEKDPQSTSTRASKTSKATDTRQSGSGTGSATPKSKGLIMIGASAGGLASLQSLVKELPADLAWPVVVYQHMDPQYGSHLAEILQRGAKVTVRAARHRDSLEPGVILIGPPDAAPRISDDGHLLLDHPVERSRDPINGIFRTGAQVFGENAVAVILSGTGSDGSAGAIAVWKAGGVVIAESDRTAEHPGMPRSARRSGAVDFVRPSSEIPAMVASIAEGTLEREPAADDAYKRILDLVREQRGTRFDEYRTPTIRRRLHKRMLARNVSAAEDYIEILEREPEEIDALFDTILINVTEFFRDEEAWEKLESNVLPTIVQDRDSAHEVRVWCAGCSTGEEAYSIAMLLAEQFGNGVDMPSVKIFATDIDEDALAFARKGVYDEARVASVSPERLERFFVKRNGGYEISKELRRLVIFGVHDLTKDPPIARLDLLICRNVLIYFEVELQRRLLGIFWYSLRGDGCLFLGRSEAVANDSASFEAVDRRLRIFRHHGQAGGNTPAIAYRGPSHHPAEHKRLAAPDESIASILNEHLLDRANVVVMLADAHLGLLFWNRYSRAVLGASDLDDGTLSEIFPSIKGAPIESAIMRTGSTGARSHVSAMEVRVRGRRMFLDFTIDPVTLPSGESGMLIVGQDASGREEAREALKERSTILQETIEQLQSTNEELQSANEELETANEELQSSNEELTTLNEEIASTNEELETTNEELQSTNEELAAVNEELEHRSSDVEHISHLLRSVVDASSNAVVVCDGNEDVIIWNSNATDLFGVREEVALGRNLFSVDFQMPVRPIRELMHEARDADTRIAARTVTFPDARKEERQVEILVRALAGIDQSPKGWIISWRDSSEELHAQRVATAASARVDALLLGTDEAILVIGTDGSIEDASASARRLLHVPDGQSLPSKLWTMTSDPDTALRLRGALSQYLAGEEAVGDSSNDIEVQIKGGPPVRASFLRVDAPDQAPLVRLFMSGESPEANEGR